MPDDFPNDELKKVWQSQPTELSTMTLEKIRHKACELRAKTRRELFGSITGLLISIAISGPGMLRTDELGLRLAFALAIVWALAGQYFFHRSMWSATLPGDAALSTGFEFYRREVRRRRSLLGRVLQWAYGPVVLSISGLILVLTGVAENRGLSVRVVFPFCTAFAIWIVAVLFRRSQGQRELQREIDELANIEKESSR